MLVDRLELRSVTKRYAAVVANEAVSLCVAPGEIHAVLGENGAGKSTLMKIVYGAVQPDSGDIFWQGERLTVASPATARRLGIGMVYQHFALFETLSVVENIAVALPGPFDLKSLAGRIVELGNRYGLTVEPRRQVHHLSTGERQRVEILRCLIQEPKLLILDEPTSVLPPQAARALFDVLRRLAAGGCSILYVSHKLEEIRQLCDRATILRGGRVVGTALPAEVSAAELARMMVGSTIPVATRRPSALSERPRLELGKLSLRTEDPFGINLRDVSLTVHGGEIVGIAGVSGHGQSELLLALGGELRSRADMIRVDGERIGHLGVTQRRARGLAFVPEERIGRGSVPNMTLAQNTLLTAHSQGLLRHCMIRRRLVTRFTRELIESFDVRCGGPAAPARSLSGGNLQKFILCREMELARAVLIVSQPTWGIDVAAAAFLRQRLIDLSRRGIAILVLSEELEELFEICDRIAVIHQGRLSPLVARDGANAEEIGLLMAGLAATA